MHIASTSSSMSSSAVPAMYIPPTYSGNMIQYTELLPLTTPHTLANNIPATVTSNKSQDSEQLSNPTNINDDLLSNYTQFVSSQHNISGLDNIQTTVISPQSSFKVGTYLILLYLLVLYT